MNRPVPMFDGRRWLRNGLMLAVAALPIVPRAQAAELEFYRDVYPFLKANCISCHNKTTTKAGLNLETPELMKKGGETGPGIVPGKGAKSLVVQAAVHTRDLEMPPKNNKSGAVNLTAAEIKTLKNWIDQGAKSSTQKERAVVWQPLAPGVHPIYSVAMTPDGRFAACGRANQIFLYDLATRQFVTQITAGAQKAAPAHRALVQSLAFSPDGTQLASGSYREVKIWRQEKGAATVRRPEPARHAVFSVLAGAGEQVVSADPAGALLVEKAVNGQLLKRIADAGKSGIKRLSVSPDGAMAAVCGDDATFGIWNLSDGRNLANKSNLKGVQAIAWTRDSKSIVTAGDDKSVRVWSLPASGTELSMATELKGLNGLVTAMLGGPAPDQLITAGDDGRVRVWNLSEGKLLREITAERILSLGLSPDGKQLVTGGADGAIRVWDFASGKQISELRGNVAAGRRIAELDWTVAAQGVEQAFQKTEASRIEAQNKALDELLRKANETIATAKKLLPEKQKALAPAQEAQKAAKKLAEEAAALAARSPDGKPGAELAGQLRSAQEKLAAATMAETSAQAAVAAVENNVKDAEADVERIAASKAKNVADLTAANTAVAAAKEKQDKAAADLAALKRGLSDGSNKPLAVALSSDGQLAAALFGDGTLNVWAVASGVPVDQVTSHATTAGSVFPAANGAFVACLADSTVLTSCIPSQWVLERVLGGDKDRSLFVDRVNALRFSPDGKTLAAGGGEPSRSGDISLFDAATGKPIASWKERHQDSVLSLDFSPDGKLLASGGADKMAKVTEVATGSQVNLFEGHTHHVMGVAFRADGRVLATAGGDAVVLVWDMHLGERKKKIEGWGKEVTSLQFIGATRQIVTSAGDNLVRIVNDDGTEVRSLSKLPDFMQSVASTPTASVVIGGGEDSLLHVWDGTSGRELAAFGAR